jgi:hypothetical protein
MGGEHHSHALLSTWLSDSTTAPGAQGPGQVRGDADVAKFWWTSGPVSVDAADVRAYRTDVPASVFDAAMQRAAAHEGYAPTSAQYKAFTVRDVTCVDFGRGDASAAHSERVMAADALPGTPILACLLRRTMLPIYAYPCDRTPDDVRYVRELSLRVHRFARLVFEAHTSSPATGSSSLDGLDGPTRNDDPESTSTRGMYVQVDVDKLRNELGRQRVPSERAQLTEDVARTVENTIQVVLLGVRPKGRFDDGGGGRARGLGRTREGGGGGGGGGSHRRT